MGSVLVFAFLAFFALAIGQAFLRRAGNPFEPVPFDDLPAAFRSDLDRLLPGFSPQEIRLTKKRDEAQLKGDYRGEPVRVEGEFDASGSLIELEMDSRNGSRKMGAIDPAELPNAAQREVDRVLGDDLQAFQYGRVTQGVLSDGERMFEVKGRSESWKWEIEVSATGRLLEVEKERLRSRS